MFLLFPYSFLQAGIVLMCPQKAMHPSSFPLLYFLYFTLTSWLWFFLFPACKFEHILSPLHAFSKCFRWGLKLENNMGKNLFRQQKYWKRRKKYYKILLFFFFFSWQLIVRLHFIHLSCGQSERNRKTVVWNCYRLDLAASLEKRLKCYLWQNTMLKQASAFIPAA